MGSEWAYGIAWSKDLETGNSAIDSQHKELFNLTSNLVEASENKKSDEVVGEALNFLASYTVQHFADEEALQVAYNFPDYERHRQLHNDFKNKVMELIQQYRADSSSVDMSSVIQSTVVRWLLQHIKREDFKIAEHIRKSPKQ